MSTTTGNFPSCPLRRLLRIELNDDVFGRAPRTQEVVLDEEVQR